MKPLREILVAFRALQEPTVLATFLSQGESASHPLGSRCLLAPGGPGRLQAEACLALKEGHPRLVRETADEAFLLEPVHPGRLAPWIHFATQLLDQGKACVTALVIDVHGDIPYLIGETFAYDARSHGLVPLDGTLNVALHRATTLARQEGTARIERFPVPGGEVVMLLDPICT